MTRFGIDATVAIRLARDDATVASAHQLVGPTLLRSEALSTLYRQVLAGEIEKGEARVLLDRITTMRIRLLGDRVSRANAWRVAEELGWADTAAAEYVAVAQLQADAFVTLDESLAAQLGGVVALATYEALLAS